MRETTRQRLVVGIPTQSLALTQRTQTPSKDGMEGVEKKERREKFIILPSMQRGFTDLGKPDRKEARQDGEFRRWEFRREAPLRQKRRLSA